MALLLNPPLETSPGTGLCTACGGHPLLSAQAPDTASLQAPGTALHPSTAISVSEPPANLKRIMKAGKTLPLSPRHYGARHTAGAQEMRALSEQVVTVKPNSHVLLQSRDALSTASASGAPVTSARMHVLCDFSPRFYLVLEREEGKEKDRERNISVWLHLERHLLGTWPTTQA